MNAFRQLLKSAGSHPPLGTWIVSASPLAAEAVGHAGFDWAVIDMEHSPLDLPQVVTLLQALSATRLVPVVRVSRHDATVVQRVLDGGAATVMFPVVQTADDARRAVAATRYPLDGMRSVAGMSRACGFGTVPNYLKTANAGIGVIVQIDSLQAIQAIEDIAAVPGVDALFVAPADLCAASGHLGDAMHPQVLQLMGDAARRARAAGKHIGSWGSTPEQAVQYRALGFDYVALSSDLGLMMRGAQAVLQSLRTQDVGSHVHTLHTGTQTADGR